MRAGGFKALIDTDKWSLVGERSHRWSLQSSCFQLPRAANANSLNGVQLLAKLAWLPWSRAVSRPADLHFEEKNEGRLLSCVHA